jgi:hypothetical protein
MAYIKGRYLNPQRGEGYHGAFLGIAGAGGVSENDIVIATGYSGDQVKFVKADADAAGLHAGLMGIAKNDADANETVVVLSHKMVKDVDTSGVTAAGYPVYLSETAGQFDDAEPSPNTMVVGSVLYKHATEGVVILAPGRMTYGIESDGTPDITHGS